MPTPIWTRQPPPTSELPHLPLRPKRRRPPTPNTVPKKRSASERALQRYRQVIDVLTEHRVGVVALEDEPAVEGPGFYVFRVGLERTKPSAIYKLSEELKLGLLDAGTSLGLASTAVPS